MTPTPQPQASAKDLFAEKLRATRARPHELQAFIESMYPDLDPAAAQGKYLLDVERASLHGPSEFFDTACEEMSSWPKPKRYQSS